MHVIKGNVGPGILALPYAFANIGMLPGILGTAFIAVVNVHCMHLVVSASHRLCRRFGHASLDYGDCAALACRLFRGSATHAPRLEGFLRVVINVFLQVTQLGVCCVYFVFVSENLSQVVNARVLGVGAGWSTRAYMALLLPFVLALACIRSIRTLSYFSMAANALCVTGFVLIFVQLCRDLPPFLDTPLVNPDVAKWPVFVATVVYAFEGTVGRNLSKMGPTETVFQGFAKLPSLYAQTDGRPQGVMAYLKMTINCIVSL
jgi:proton-coupled amino acid transporter